MTASTGIIVQLTRAYPFVELTDEMISKLEGLSEQDLEKAINFLSFIPKTLQLELCNPPFDLETLKDLSIETLESLYFPHFEQMLESKDIYFVEKVTKFLYTNFVNITPPMIPIDSPRGQLIFTMHFLSCMDSAARNFFNKKNPFHVFSEITSARKLQCQALLPYQTLEGKTVALNLDEITETADKDLIQCSYDDLKTALGRDPISTKEIRDLFQALRNRNGTQINKVLIESGQRTLEDLEVSLCDDTESSKWHRTDSPDEPVSKEKLLFNACFNFYLSNLLPPSSDSPLSDSEFALLSFINIFRDCPSGRMEQLRKIHLMLKPVLPPLFQESSETANFLKDYLYETYRNELTNFLTDNPELFAKFHPEATNLHESRFLINLLGRRLGLVNETIFFDPNTEFIHSEILSKSTEELFQLIVDQFTPEVLISKIQAKIIQDLDERSLIKNVLGSSFGPFLTGPEMGWYYELVENMAPPDPSKELISKLFVQNILLHAGILQARDKSSDAEAKPYLSLGLDDTGHLLAN